MDKKNAQMFGKFKKSPYLCTQKQGTNIINN